MPFTPKRPVPSLRTSIIELMNMQLIENMERLLSKERGTVFKDPGGKINVALVYPNVYSVGMSSLGFQGIYGLLNRMNDVVCERFFLPSPDDIIEHERTDTELFSFESRRSLARFDIVAFSVSFENDYPNILKMLQVSHIPPRSAERNASHPLVVMGGVCAFYNPEPMAAFFDICFIGEAEEMLPEFLDVYRGTGTREGLYSMASGIEGVYIPSYYAVNYDGETGQISGRTPSGKAPSVIKKCAADNISDLIIRPVIITPEAEFSDMYLAEVMRGCPWACRFCVAGHIYKPVRKKELSVLRQEIKEALKITRRVGLVGPSLSDYPHAAEVLETEEVDFSITSLRASRMSGRLVELMRGHKSISIAPEAGTERLRTVINKKIRESDILETAEIILSSGIETLRLYFMVGLPTETREDIEGIITLVKEIRSRNKRGFITLSASTFVPKPFTPFQWHCMEKMSEVKERMRLLKKGLGQEKGVKVFHDVVKDAYIQGMFSVGDRRSSRLIELAAAGGNPIKESADARYYLFRRKDISEDLPWDFIDSGVPKERLWHEYREALGL
ncbi:MAG: radical SAM protein [Nitrospirae bacterium]|nr:radical SAM protein [Nitrospirota bacterium]